MDPEIKNLNLYVATKLIWASCGIHYLGDPVEILLDIKELYRFSAEEIFKSLRRLEFRGIIQFNDEVNKKNIDTSDCMSFLFDEIKAMEFINIAKDEFYGILKKYSTKKDLNYVFEALSKILDSMYLSKEITFSEIRYTYVEILEWIADYSGIIKITYEEHPDFDWDTTRRPDLYSVFDIPKSVHILKRIELEKLYSELRKFALLPEQKRIKSFLDKYPQTDWKCADCGHFLNEKLNSEEQISKYIDGFRFNKFRVCYKCRKRNLFSISQKGEMKFSTTWKKVLGQMGKGFMEERLEQINRKLGRIIKTGTIPKEITGGIDKEFK